jgi:hypothetical protein
VASPFHTQLAEWLAACGELTEVLRLNGCLPQMSAQFDAVVVCMTETDGSALACELPDCRLVIVPVFLTGIEPADIWWQQFQTHRFLTFSRRQHEQLLRAGLETAYFQPFPSVEQSAGPDAGSSAMLWERTGSKWGSVELAARQCLALGLKRLHVAGMAARENLAQVGDNNALSPFVQAGVDIHIAEGGQRPDDMASLLTCHAMIVLPSACVAEIPVLAMAMAMGRVVLAPAGSLAGDYVGHGVSGVLYDQGAPLAALVGLDQSGFSQLAAGAQARARRGNGRWIEDATRLMSWLLADGHRWSATDVAAGFANMLRRRAGEAAIVH